MAIGLQVWSKTAASNSNADTNINWAEGMAPSQVNDSARAEMASVALWRDDNNGSIVTAGSSTAFTATSNQIEAALTSGYTIAVQFHAVNDASATLAVDSLTAKPLQVIPGSNVLGGEFPIDSIARFTYSTTGTGQWIAQGARPKFFSSPSSLASTMSTAITVPTTADVDGPFVAQGSTGVWLAMGTVTLESSISGGSAQCKLWDGTTTIASATGRIGAASSDTVMTLTGIISNPVGNIKMTASLGSGIGNIIVNDSGYGKDSALTVVRIG